MIKKRAYLIAVLRKYEILIASGIVIVGIVVLTALFFLPNFRKAKNIYSQRIGLQQQKDSLSKKDKALDEIDYNYFLEVHPKINWVLPDNRDFVSLFSTYDYSQSKTGASIQRTNFQLGTISTGSASLGPTTSEGAYMVPLTIDIAGDFSQLLKFIESLTDFSGRFITIEEVQWSLEEGSLFAKLSGKAYFYPFSAKIGSIDAPVPSLDKEKEEILRRVDQNNLVQNETLEFEKIHSGKNNLFQ